MRSFITNESDGLPASGSRRLIWSIATQAARNKSAKEPKSYFRPRQNNRH